MGACHIFTLLLENAPVEKCQSETARLKLRCENRAALVQIVSAVTLPTPLFKQSLFPQKKCGTGSASELAYGRCFRTRLINSPTPHVAMAQK